MKLQLRGRKLEAGNIIVFQTICDVAEDADLDKGVHKGVEADIKGLLTLLEEEFFRYFPQVDNNFPLMKFFFSLMNSRQFQTTFRSFPNPAVTLRLKMHLFRNSFTGSGTQFLNYTPEQVCLALA